MSDETAGDDGPLLMELQPDACPCGWKLPERVCPISLTDKDELSGQEVENLRIRHAGVAFECPVCANLHIFFNTEDAMATGSIRGEA